MHIYLGESERSTGIAARRQIGFGRIAVESGSRHGAHGGEPEKIQMTRLILTQTSQLTLEMTFL